MKKIGFLTAAVTAVFMSSVYAVSVEVSGECVGVKLYTDGLIVCDTTAVIGHDGTKRDVAAENDIAVGDIIIRADGEKVTENSDIIRALSQSDGDITLTLRRGDKEREVTVVPAETDMGPKLGLWLRDSTAGFGTVTCFVGDRFAALGHGICDVDTGDIMPAAKGIIQKSTILNTTKSRNGMPGAISGVINGEVLGTITDNRENGLFGIVTHPQTGTAMEIACGSEVRCGDASMLADVDGEGVKEYSIEIKRIDRAANGRDMIIRVTDAGLIEKVGGIVQGMSGAPILQDGRLAGAVTHVFVNDTLSGYGIFAENLLKDIS